MPRQLIVRTPENVEITHSLAGIGSRFLAVVVDHLLQIASLIIVAFAVLYATSGLHGAIESFANAMNLSGWAIAVVVAFVFLDFWGYFILFETLWNGQTPGKRLLNVRVVKENGRPIDFFSAASRNIARIIDLMPGMYATGVVTMFFSPSYKRVGDYVAGTVVVKEYRQPVARRSKGKAAKGSQTALGVDIDSRSDGGSTNSDIDGAPADEIPGVTIPTIRQVTREEYDAARRFLDRREELPPAISGDLARRIAEPILSRLDMTPDQPDRYPYEAFLEALAHDYLRWQDLRYS